MPADRSATSNRPTGTVARARPAWSTWTPGSAGLTRRSTGSAGRPASWPPPEGAAGAVRWAMSRPPTVHVSEMVVGSDGDLAR